jgi:very-short-patch-repair endonuclease
MYVKGRASGVDRAIGALAERQHGVVSRRQLLELGVDRGAILHRLKLARLRPVHRGIYTIGHRLLTQHGRWMAAVLAYGPHAVLSHRAAAALWGMRGGTRVEVTVPSGLQGRDGIQVYRAKLPADERTTHRGIPTTTVPRTLLDLSAVVTKRHLRGALREAEHLRLSDPLSLHDLIARYPRRPGLKAIKALLAEASVGARIIRSELEERFQDFLVRAGLPLPQTNVVIEGYEVDCVWPEQRLIVELDGHASHSPTHAFELDRARDRKLEAAGWRVIRITWRQLEQESELVEADLRRLLQPGESRATPLPR